MVVHGALDLQGALNLRSAGAQQWKIAGVIAAITLVLGIIVIWNPFVSINVLLMLVGIALIYDGLSDLLIIFHLSRTFNMVKHAVEEAMEEVSEETADVIESTGEIKE